MQLTAFNQQSPTQLENWLQHLVKIPRWATEISAARPFKNIDDLLLFAQQQTHTWTWSEVLAALNTHPRIGEKKAKNNLSAQEQKFSHQEQAVCQAQQNPKILAELEQGNRQYEQRFGYIFLIKAAGLSSEEILFSLHQRLNNDDNDEQNIVKQQLSEIALLRLTQELSA